jgi:FAD/FMN-containing dehydrogenase
MNDRDTTEHQGANIPVDEEAVAAFEGRVRGPVFRSGEDGYEQARSIWNGMIDKRPALVQQASGAADVIECVNFARDKGLLLSVRGGGHNIAGTAVADGGLMIDQSHRRGVHVDPRTGVTRVEPGCDWGDVDRETQLHGLVVPGGIVSTTGVAGFTLGGGFGWVTRSYGLASDNLLSVDIVTADGVPIRASESEHPELFWALRGGGGNFGIVTSFEFQAHPVGPTVVAGIVFHPMDKAKEVIDLYRKVTAAAPDELCCLLVLRLAPPAPFLAKEVHGTPVAAIAVCYNGPIADGEKAVAPIKAFGTPLCDTIQPKPFIAHQSFLDSGQPFGRQYYWKSDYFLEMSPKADDVLIDHASRITSPFSGVLAMHLGGASGRVGETETAAGNRDAQHVFNVQAAWEDPAENDVHIAWTRDYWRAMQPFSSGGTYVNFLTRDEGDDRVRAAYGPAIHDRLVEVKTKYDPGNLFRSNQNIRPRGQ